ncbi:hypothetical protein [Bacillus thuringiensis]|nr:hypothetical protein [Bacillus thuringiensis]
MKYKLIIYIKASIRALFIICVGGRIYMTETHLSDEIAGKHYRRS